MPEHIDDVGFRAVRRLHDLLRIDAKWCKWQDRGFAWWPWYTLQMIIAQPQRAPSGVMGARVVIATDIATVQGQQCSPDTLAWALDTMRRAPLGCGLLCDQGDDGSLVFRYACGAFVTDDNFGWLINVLSLAAITQAYYAIPAEPYPAETGLILSRSAHPGSGVRETPDEITGVIPHVVLPAGEKSSAWNNQEEFEAAARELNDPRIAVATTGPLAVTANIPIKPTFRTTMASGSLADTALLTINTDVPHPDFGHGMLCRLYLPQQVVDVTDLGVPSMLNAREFDENIDNASFGCWTVGPAPGSSDIFVPAYGSFWPNFIYQPGLLEWVVRSMVVRARHTRGVLYEGEN